MSSSYFSRLAHAISTKATPALVGLDPRWELLPTAVIEVARQRIPQNDLAQRAFAYQLFCERIIDVVAPLVPAVKPQAAFFEALGPPGVAALRNVIRYARDRHLIVICDAKRGDIGSTAEAYAAAYLAGEDPDAAPFAADALTVSPYLGDDTLSPFIELCKERGAGIYVLVRTSNPGSGKFQGIRDEAAVFQHVANCVEELADKTRGDDEFGCVGAVVGATYPEELQQLRERMPHAPLLIPGYGSQGGTASDVRSAFSRGVSGALVNSSRGINFAFRQEPWCGNFGEARWEEAVEAAARAMIADLAS